MNIRDQQYIKVMNYGLSQVCLEGKSRGYILPPAGDDGPSVEYLSFQDIEYVNSRSPVFTSGLLRFDEAQEEELFNELKCFKWREKLWSEADVEDVVLSPTPENQKRILAVKDIQTLERIRGCAVRMVNSDSDAITTKVVELINNRFAELNAGKINSTIIPFSKPVSAAVPNSAEMDAMKAKNDELESKLAEMSKMMEQLMAAQTAQAAPAAEKSVAPAPAKRAANTTKRSQAK